MNNPMKKSPSSSGGPPIAKKQRGGRTPGSIKARQRQTQTQTQRRATTNTAAAGPPPPFGAVDDAIARRRAELRRLQEKARSGGGLSSKTTTTSTTSNSSSTTSNASPRNRGPPPLSSSAMHPKRTSDIFPSVAPKSPSMIPKHTTTTRTTRTMKPPTTSFGQQEQQQEQQVQEQQELHRSDAFPSVAVPEMDPASSKNKKNNPNTNRNNDTNTNTNTIETTSARIEPPKVLAGSSTGTAASSSNPNLPPETPIGAAIPPTPAVGRRLEFPSNQKPQSSNANGNNGTTTKTTKPPRRARSKSPLPNNNKASSSNNNNGLLSKSFSVGNSNSNDNSKNNTNSSSLFPATRPTGRNRNPRARSAPPRRPPGPPPGKRAPSDKSASTSTSMSSSNNNNTKVVVAKKKKIARPAPLKPPGPRSLLPTVETRSPGSKKPNNTKTSTPPLVDSGAKSSPQKATAAPESSPATGRNNKSATPPPSGPPLTVHNDDKPQATTETPLAQKPFRSRSGSGADTPPSSGSSARRQKLQLMQKQAMVASTIDIDDPTTSTTTTSTTTNRPPKAASLGSSNAPPTTATTTTTSFYRPGQPATAAFARATAPKASSSTTENENEIEVFPRVPDLTNNGRSEDDKRTTTTPSKQPPQPQNNNNTKSASRARLEDAYQRSEREKTRALVKIKELEDRLSQTTREDLDRSKQTHKQQKLDVYKLLQLAEKQGPEAALEWARSNDVHNDAHNKAGASRTGFNTGMGVTSTTPRKMMGGDPSRQTPYRRARIAVRALRAQPNNNNNNTRGGSRDQPANNDDDESPEATEKRLIRRFKEAAKYVSYEFSSDLATYVVRRPYGIPTSPGLFDHCRPHTEKPEAYARKAHVSDKNTVEVAAVARADNTPILVFGVAGIRYQTNPSSKNVPPEWKHVEDVDAEDRPLGHVTYIDKQALEKEYSLDEILEEALLVREQYCGTLTSTALALPDLQQQAQTQAQQPQTVVSQKPPLAEAKPDQPASKPKKEEQQQQPPKEESVGGDNNIDSGSSDVLVVFLGMVVSGFFNLVWGIFIGTPLKIVHTTVVLVAVSVVVQVLHLYLADGYNEWALREFASNNGASVCSSVVASDLSWYSNQHPGIL